MLKRPFKISCTIFPHQNELADSWKHRQFIIEHSHITIANNSEQNWFKYKTKIKTKLLFRSIVKWRNNPERRSFSRFKRINVQLVQITSSCMRQSFDALIIFEILLFKSKTKICSNVPVKRSNHRNLRTEPRFDNFLWHTVKRNAQFISLIDQSWYEFGARVAR